MSGDNSQVLKNRSKFMVFVSLISLKTLNESMKLSLNHLIKLKKEVDSLRFYP